MSKPIIKSDSGIGVPLENVFAINGILDNSGQQQMVADNKSFASYECFKFAKDMEL